MDHFQLKDGVLHAEDVSLRRIAEEGDAADFKDWLTVNRVLHTLFDLKISGPGQGETPPARTDKDERTGS